MANVTVEPLSPALGATVRGVQLAQVDDWTEVDRLFADHLVLVFPDQRGFSADVHVRVGTHFGDPFIHPFLTAVDGHPEILEVIKEATDEDTFGGEYWHCDISFRNPPSSVSLLRALELPPLGGDTLFANQFLAYERLSPGMQRMLAGLDAWHVYPDMDPAAPGVAARHPVVRVHPVSGRRAIFVNGAFVHRFDGMTEAESAPLLRQLFAHQVSPEFTCRVSWSPGQVVIWDNRATLHYAMNDYAGHRRLLQRVTVMER